MEQIRLLIVEDNPADARLVNAFLEDHAKDAFVSVNVSMFSDALQKLSSELFDAVLLDLDLPDSFGLETVERIVEHVPSVPVIVFTGNAEGDLGLQAIKKGATDYLVKGKIDAALLDRRIRYAIERKKKELALKEREQRMRLKLESVLSPEGDLGDLKFSDIIDAPAIQELMNEFHALVPIPMAIIDLKGEVLVGVGWQSICTDFHRTNPQTCAFCIESDTQLSAGLKPGAFRLYKCKNNMWDVATPIMVGGRHVGNVFSGQFFFDDETLDYELFRSQARTYGFDERKYLAALDLVPRLSRKTMETAMDFYMKLARMISSQGYNNLLLARSLSERERVEAVLEKEQLKLNAIFDAVNVGMLLIDGNGVVQRVNNVAADWVEKSVDSCCGTQPGDALGCVHALAYPKEGCGDTPHCRDCPIRRAFETALKSGNPVHDVETEMTLSIKDKNVRLWLDISVDPIQLSDGRYAVMAMSNITTRKKAEEELRRLNMTLKALSDSRQAMTRAKNEESYLKEVCRLIVTDCGFSMCWIGFAEQDTDKSVRPMAQAGFDEGYIESLKVTWADTERGQGPTGTAIRTGKLSMCRDMLNDQKFRPWRDDALKRGYASSLVLPLIADSRSFGALSIYAKEPDAFKDDQMRLLTELADDLSYGIVYLRLRSKQKEAEEVLRRDKETLAQLVQEKTRELKVNISQLQKAQAVGNLGSWFLDIEKDELHWSEEVYSIFGMARGKLTYESFLATVHPDDRDYVDQRWQAALRREKYDIEHRILVGGKVKWVREMAELEFDKDGRPLRGIGVAQDITRQKEAEGEKAELQQEMAHVARHVLMGEFSSALAHELNQPLAAILSNAQATRRFLSQKFDPAEIREIIDDIIKDSTRAGDVIKKLRLLLNKGQLNMQVIDICEVLREAVSFINNELMLKNIKLALRCNGSLPVLADRTQIQQVMLNLIKNSSEAMESSVKKQIFITVAETGNDKIVITTRDSGKGFAGKDLNVFFQPFYTTKPTGMGMGLAISKRIMESHGGCMEIRNHPRGGAVVIIELQKAKGSEGKHEKSSRVRSRR
jgi:PAS domain S-box-containing protein